MNTNFDTIIQATDDDRRGLFLTTANSKQTVLEPFSGMLHPLPDWRSWHTRDSGGSFFSLSELER
jgi:hypothetical protein